MHDLPARHHVAQYFSGPTNLDLQRLQGESPLVAGGTRKESLQRHVQPRAGSGRPGNQQRAFAPSQELRVKQKEWQAAEMVAMQMGQDDAIDASVIEAQRFERHQRRGAAIDK